MKKFETLCRSLSKGEQKNSIGGDYDTGNCSTQGCLPEFSIECCMPSSGSGEPCCSGLACVFNATNSGTICVGP